MARSLLATSTLPFFRSSLQTRGQCQLFRSPSGKCPFLRASTFVFVSNSAAPPFRTHQFGFCLFSTCGLVQCSVTYYCGFSTGEGALSIKFVGLSQTPAALLAGKCSSRAAFFSYGTSQRLKEDYSSQHA